ncbi:hypothetical protein P5G50_05845 [Leifsonia sp. F6_8S_P_1B]|uniref:Uncharacterized protein n=1 Tax=Leifsonia williamsii TaxID=3035919 RepID=A0ABT8KAA2_9MICO|nr:hypothetical protein [Leifsonia williamsii]MDN4613972.1 hypothetical protein [Leifsonia williamsii]
MTALPSPLSTERLTEVAAGLRTGLRTVIRRRVEALRRTIRRSDALRLAAGLAASGTALALLFVGCALLLVEVVTPALAEAARPLGIAF